MSILDFVLLVGAFTLAVALLGVLLQIARFRKKIALLFSQLADNQEINLAQSNEISNLKKELAEKNLADPLTGLPTRQVFEDRLAVTLLQSARYHQICSVMMLDLDHFKMINEALSLEAGDFLLRAVSERLLESIRQIDTLSRFGGNQFLFIFPQIMKPETSGYIARRLLDDLSRPFTVDGQEIYLTASIGISVFPADGSDVSSLMKNANTALRYAKEQGRNIYQFYRAETQALSKRDLILDACLRQESVCREFVIYYQPEVHADTRRIISMTAFPYWDHPEFGLLPFEVFAGLAEASGRIHNIGEWLIRMVCQQLLIWRERDFFPSAVAVPLSLKQLENQHFVHNLGATLQEYRLTPESLSFIITDTTFAVKIDRVEKMLRILEHLGIRKAVYSFGIGDLSLQYLRRLSVDIFRIDSSLVKDLGVHRESDSIVKIIIALAASLNATVVAEGVETVEQKDLLMQMNCYVMQGPLFGLPQLAESITASSLEKIGDKV